ncbi:MAG: hypothetical protein WA941_16420 [Nitrososphaeraceae archaeon]
MDFKGRLKAKTALPIREHVIKKILGLRVRPSGAMQNSAKQANARQEY